MCKLGIRKKKIFLCNKFLYRKPLETFLLQAEVTETFTLLCLANKNNGLVDASLCH